MQWIGPSSPKPPRPAFDAHSADQAGEIGRDAIGRRCQGLRKLEFYYSEKLSQRLIPSEGFGLEYRGVLGNIKKSKFLRVVGEHCRSIQASKVEDFKEHRAVRKALVNLIVSYSVQLKTFELGRRGHKLADAVRLTMTQYQIIARLCPYLNCDISCL